MAAPIVIDANVFVSRWFVAPAHRDEFIRQFNDYARSHSHALLPITAYTSELDKALDVHEDNLGDLFDTVAEAVENFTGESDKRLTLVRLAWGSY